jgi:PHD-finger
VRHIEAIKVDHEKYQRCEVDGTGWDGVNDLVSSVKIFEAVKSNMAKQLTPAMELKVGKSILLENTVEPKQPSLSAAEKKRREISPWPLQCDGCGEVGDGYEAEGKTVQCDICKNWSHTECFADSFELSVDNDNGTWSCPLCRNIVVWADRK